MKRCQMPGCFHMGVLGWGSPPTVLCLLHFERALATAARVVKYWRGAPRPERPTLVVRDAATRPED